jgi:hypothetical protein
MGRIKTVDVGIEDRVTVAKYQSVAPPIRLVAEVAPEDDVAVVQASLFETAGEMWEKQMCLRLWWRIDMAQKFGGPMPEPWAMQMYEYLYKKHYAEKNGGTG